MRTNWPSRQVDAATGFIPIIAISVGAATGGALADVVGLPVIAGALVFGVVGFFTSRFVLRRHFSGSQTPD